MARTKHTMKKRTLREDHKTVKTPKVPKNKGKMTATAMGKTQSKILLTWDKSIIGDLAISEIH